MQRKALDRIVSWLGMSLAVILIVAGSLLTWANSFIGTQVHNELASQQVYFPAKGSPAIAAAEYAPIRQYAGQQLTTPAQAQAYANHFIANHLKEIGGGQTYAQLSAQAQANPTDTKLAATVNSMFKGETLRGLLLDAYAFGTMGFIAGIAAIAAFIGAGLMLALAALGLINSRRTPSTEAVFGAVAERTPVGVS
jgi:hypothetical protein